VNLRPNQTKQEVEEGTASKENTDTDAKAAYVKTSITLSREIAVRARKYVNEQQLAHAQGQRQNNYSFSQLYNDALNFYLDYLEKGDTHEKDS
jgi:hypothetical protein